jgi:hypothetical protein
MLSQGSSVFIIAYNFRYPRKTSSLHLEHSTSAVPETPVEDSPLWGYVDSTWAGCPDTGLSTSGEVLMLNGAAVSWHCKRQSVFALSTAEAEFFAASSTVMVQEVTTLVSSKMVLLLFLLTVRSAFTGLKAPLVAAIVHGT